MLIFFYVKIYSRNFGLLTFILEEVIFFKKKKSGIKLSSQGAGENNVLTLESTPPSSVPGNLLGAIEEYPRTPLK